MPKSYTGVYTSSGKPVYNVEAYAATGAPTFSSSGKVCVCIHAAAADTGRGQGRGCSSPHRSSRAQELFAPVAYAETVDSAKRQSSSNPKYLYHYTDEHSLRSISSSGYIKSSSGPGMPIESCAREEGSFGQRAQLPKRPRRPAAHSVMSGCGICDPLDCCLGPPWRTDSPNSCANCAAAAGDCALGKGVYLTGKTPKCRSSSLLANNYGSSHVHKERAAKTKGYVRVDAEKVGASNGADRLGRNVWVTPGDLDLRHKNAMFGRR